MKNLIGLSGKMQSGKDTVALIIQDLTTNSIGADDYRELVNKTGLMPISTNKSSFEIKKFAGKLKDIVCLLIGCTREQLEDDTFKNSPLSSDWDDSYGISTPRELLQILGTNCGRDMIHKNIWVNALFADYKKGLPMIIDNPKISFVGNEVESITLKQPKSFWLITDMRFPNEAKSIKDRDGITIRVNRPRIAIEELSNGTKRIAKNPIKEHESETALDSYSFDYTIDNDGSLEDLVDKVSEILRKEEIIN